MILRLVLVSTLGAVRSRQREIGVLRASGFRKRHVMDVVLFENLLVGVAASIVGVLLALVLSPPFARLVAGVDGALLPEAVVIPAAIGASTLLVLLSSLYPAWVASRLSPLVALRRI